MAVHAVCLALLARNFLVALSVCNDLREDCSEFGINIVCTYEAGSMYGLLKTDRMIQRVNFDRLSTGLDGRNFPNLATLEIKSKQFDQKPACAPFKKIGHQ